MMNRVNASELRRMLDRGVVRFSFRKRDGSVRNALGTRNTNLIPKTENVLDVEDISSKSIVYWDLESRGYRSLQSNARTEVLEQ